MKILYFECGMGAAGDMLMSALSEIHPDPDDFFKRFSELGIPNVGIKREKTVKSGIAGTHIRVFVGEEEENEHMHEHHEHEHKHHEHEHNHEHHHHEHNTPEKISDLIKSLPLSKKVCEDALGIYKILADAEAHVHGCTPENIHFHEVGTMDAVADIVGVCMLINEIRPDKIAASAVNVGGGHVRCAHGLLPVPAPAAARILQGIPVFSNTDEGELCTPTGAAILKYFARSFGTMPAMSIANTGCGVGTKDFKNPNILRVFVGESEDKNESIYELNCNIDDMTGEEISFACARLFEAGARDVFTTPINMKKNRPGLLLTCICADREKEAIVEAIFKHTSTIGIREKECKRYVLERREETAKTPYGSIRVKRSSGYGTERVKAEYDDIEKAALESGKSISSIKKDMDIR